uniref:HDC14094 n=1 Tax=Drosophila melanogaster TaxID=7227 RepID=Q6IJW0_DROME|nr:TPA_inf: HDC14094 [Drosophila melanogaster]
MSLHVLLSGSYAPKISSVSSDILRLFSNSYISNAPWRTATLWPSGGAVADFCPLMQASRRASVRQIKTSSKAATAEAETEIGNCATVQRQSRRRSSGNGKNRRHKDNSRRAWDGYKSVAIYGQARWRPNSVLASISAQHHAGLTTF